MPAPKPKRVGVDTPASGKEGSSVGAAVLVGVGAVVPQTQSVSEVQDGFRQKPE